MARHANSANRAEKMNDYSFYYQIDKNSKKEFFDLKTDRTQLTAEDYEVAADALIRNAKEIICLF